MLKPTCRMVVWSNSSHLSQVQVGLGAVGKAREARARHCAR